MEETFSSLVHPPPPPFSTPRLAPATRAVPPDRQPPAPPKCSGRPCSAAQALSREGLRRFVCRRASKPEELVLALGTCPWVGQTEWGLEYPEVLSEMPTVRLLEPKVPGVEATRWSG